MGWILWVRLSGEDAYYCIEIERRERRTSAEHFPVLVAEVWSRKKCLGRLY
jgi:hypothetical protein